MSDDTTKEALDTIQPWLREQIDSATSELFGRRILTSDLIEVKPAWTLPHRILIGQARPQGRETDVVWFICGEVPFDAVSSDVAGIPREAAKHFAMKWQLDADKLEGEAADELIDIAEGLYVLTEDDRLWQEG